MFDGKTYNAGDVMSWPLYKPIIAHDVARSRDRSTAVVGGTNPYGAEQVGIVAARELPQGLFASDRANALAKIDETCSSLIVADLSNDSSYAEILLHTFGRRVIGLHISRYGDGMEAERLVHPIWVYLGLQDRADFSARAISENLVVQLGNATEDLNRHWYQRCTGQTLTQIQKHVRHPIHKWMAATLDGIVAPSGAVFEAKFMLPWNFAEEAAAQKHMAQLQHNMWVTAARTAVLSIITGGGKWVEMTIPRRSAVPAPAAHRRAEVLALRAGWHSPSAVRHRSATPQARGGQNRRHEWFKRVGRACQSLPHHPIRRP